MVTSIMSPVALMVLKLPALYFFRGNQAPQLFSGKMGNENSLFGDTCEDLHLFLKGTTEGEGARGYIYCTHRLLRSVLSCKVTSRKDTVFFSCQRSVNANHV